MYLTTYVYMCVCSCRVVCTCASLEISLCNMVCMSLHTYYTPYNVKPREIAALSHARHTLIERAHARTALSPRKYQDSAKQSTFHLRKYEGSS